MQYSLRLSNSTPRDSRIDNFPLLLSGIIIVGGKPNGNIKWSQVKAEIFNPRTKHSCLIENPKPITYGHTMCNNMVCGGQDTRTRKSCRKFDGISTFKPLPVRLVQPRYAGHLCWGLRSGEVLLLGGKRGSVTTERVSADGSSSSVDFELAHSTS